LCVCGLDGLFVEPLRIEEATLDTGNLRAYQRRPVLEILGTILRPRVEFPLVGCQRGNVRVAHLEFLHFCHAASGRSEDRPLPTDVWNSSGRARSLDRAACA